MDYENFIEMSIDLEPMGKPRQTQRDKWDPSPAALRYRAFKDELVLRARERGYRDDLDVYRIDVVAFITTPRSWSNLKKETHDLKPHRSKPDADNILKAVVDALLKDDSGVWEKRIKKRWSRSAGYLYIVIYYNQTGELKYHD